MAAEPTIDYKQVTFSCSCGAKYNVGSTIGEDTHIEICSNCHPFYTKKQKLVDSAGRVERFKQKYAIATPKKQASKEDGKEES